MRILRHADDITQCGTRYSELVIPFVEPQGRGPQSDPLSARSREGRCAHEHRQSRFEWRVKKLTAVLIVLSAMGAGCTPIGSLPSPALENPVNTEPRQAPPAPSIPTRVTGTSTRQSSVALRRSRRHQSAPARVAQPTLAPPAITLSGNSADKSERLLANADDRIAEFEHKKPGDADSRNYDQAVDFAAKGHRAEQAQDYVAAASFARKALLLLGTQ